MFSLILRFVGCNQKISFRNYDFMKKQLKAIQEHINQFPAKEKEFRAIEWIEKHAREYRKMWENEIINEELTSQRCPDCPLTAIHRSEHCQIHDQWLEILRQYVTDEINSKKYIEMALKLLAQNKKSLKIKLSMLKAMERN
jgi:predicted RNA-binding Zn-ribbon protein involved in translation (DUF1610 family)